MTDELLVATNVVKHYDISPALNFGAKTLVRAVDGVDLPLRKGESLGIVGESGCAFRPRCPIAVDDCAAEVPPLLTVGPGREAACIRRTSVAAKEAV